MTASGQRTFYFFNCSGDIPQAPACTPSQNIRVNPTRIDTIVAIDNKGTNKKKAPMLARNIRPAKVRRRRIVIALKEQVECHPLKIAA
jgi:hypothetical protein